MCMNDSLDTAGILRRMRQAYAVKNDSELAGALGLSVSALSNWRQRNSPPFAICADIACKKSISLDWLIFGIGEMQRDSCENVRKGEKSQMPNAAAQRISQFVTWWGIHRSQDELVWLEQQIKRAIPEYGEWLASPSRHQG